MNFFGAEMSALRAGKWQIQAVLVNDQTVLNNDGFRHLEITTSEFVVQPIGFRFAIQQSTPRSAVLESRGQIYFADFSLQGDAIDLKLSRPNFAETIRIEAEFIDEDIPSFV